MKQEGYRLFCYIDDYLAVLPKSKAGKAFNDLCELLIELGLPPSIEKTPPPFTRLTCLGIDVTINTNIISMAQEKIDAIYGECALVNSKTKLSKSKFQSLTGKLLYIHKCVRPSHIFVNRILALLRDNANKAYIHLTQDIFRDIQWFIHFLPRFNGVVFINKDDLEDNETLCIDASLTDIGGVWGNRVYAIPILDIPDFAFKIVHLEMINILITIRICSKHCQHKSVTFFCDNMAVVQVVQPGKTKDPMLAACIRNIWLEASMYDITIKIEHIKGKSNVAADAFSRLYSENPVDHQQHC